LRRDLEERRWFVGVFFFFGCPVDLFFADRLEDGVDEDLVGDCTDEFGTVVDDGLGDAGDLEGLGHLRELLALDDLRLHVGVRHGDRVGRTGHTRTVRSGRCDEHSQMNRLIDEVTSGVGDGVAQHGPGLGEGLDAGEDRGEFVADGRAVEADAPFVVVA
jgi:hypothetical protein